MISILKRESAWHIITACCDFYLGAICRSIFTASIIWGQSDQMRCQNVRNEIVFKILPNVVQYDTYTISELSSKYKVVVTFCE